MRHPFHTDGAADQRVQALVRCDLQTWISVGASATQKKTRHPSPRRSRHLDQRRYRIQHDAEFWKGGKMPSDAELNRIYLRARANHLKEIACQKPAGLAVLGAA